ncbi:MAG TPA: O-antigen ligase family protein [Chloroflexota bacterium]|jgi:O-antigen ligase|nr:O-antigen ligase family protein [Chloroflexota bacterium]
MVTPPAALPTAGGKPIRQLVPLALVVVAVLALGRSDGQFPNAPLLLALAVGAFVLLPNSPSWAVAPLLITELTISDYIVKEIGLSLRLAVAAAAVALSARLILRSAPLGDPRFRRVLLPALAFVVTATAINAAFSESDYAFKYFRYQLGQLLFLLVAACTIRDRRGLACVGAVALAVGAASGFAGLWQHVDRHDAIFGAANAEIFSDWKGRSLGLSNNPVTMANNMLFVLAPMVGFAAAGVLPRGRLRLIAAGAFLFLTTGMYFTYTRSAMLALGAGLAGSALLLRGRRRTVIFGAIVGLYLLFQLAMTVGVVGGRYAKNTTNDRSAAGHEALLTVGLAVAADNFLIGIGHEHFEEISAQYAFLVADEESAVGGQEAVGNERPHNDFLSVLISWGSIGLIAYLAIVVGTLRNCAAAARRDDRLVRGMAVACACGLVTYLTNSAFHNSLDSSTALWLYAGLSVALVRIPEQPPARGLRSARPRLQRHRHHRRRPAARVAAQYAFGG